MIRSAAYSSSALERVTETICQQVKPRQVILFGSRARGDAYEDSDIDILVIVDNGEDAEKCRRRINAALRHDGQAADVIVRSEDAFDKRRLDVGTLDYRIACDGRTLYRRPGVAASSTPRTRLREGAPDSGTPASVAEWIQRARNDLTVLRKLLAFDRPEADVVCFHAHQGVEKLLKAVIIAGHTPPPRTHDLAALLAHCPAHIRGSDAITADCRVLQELWPKTRYPEAAMPDDGEAREAGRAAERLFAVLFKALDAPLG